LKYIISRLMAMTPQERINLNATWGLTWFLSESVAAYWTSNFVPFNYHWSYR